MDVQPSMTATASTATTSRWSRVRITFPTDPNNSYWVDNGGLGAGQTVKYTVQDNLPVNTLMKWRVLVDYSHDLGGWVTPSDLAQATFTLDGVNLFSLARRLPRIISPHRLPNPVC